jgi:hypothetical protein
MLGAVLGGFLVPVSTATGSAFAHSRGGRVLLVGTYKGRKGAYGTIQAAVNAAKPGDWVLVGPGDYHEVADANASGDAISQGDFGGVYISTPGIHLRGMDRNRVVVDGTNPGGSAPCAADAAGQNFGPPGPDGGASGRNGILIWKASGVSVENLTICNFLAGSGDAGNELWWNGGDGTGQIGLTGYTGRYLTATSTYFGQPDTAALYGIFASNAAGPGTWSTVYGSNFADSGMYVGACLRVCGATITDAWMQYSALGYSGTNSGGSIVIDHSQFDHNKDGLDTNTQLNGDPPAPQDGSCPGKAVSPITRTHSCWVFTHNKVDDNNNPNVPQTGNAAAGPTGTGMTVSGGRNDTVVDNTFSNNGAWGVLFVPYPDSKPPSLNQTCAGTGGTEQAAFGCVYDPEGNALLHNTFVHNAFFGNPGNVDFGEITLTAGLPQNCYAHNRAPSGTAPSGLEKTQPTCGAPSKASQTSGPLLGQVLCDTGLGECPAGASYPQSTGVVMMPLPRRLATMPNPCADVPANPWC